jgi:hypothetical protein
MTNQIVTTDTRAVANPQQPGYCSLVVLKNIITDRLCWISPTRRPAGNVLEEIFRFRRNHRPRLQAAKEKYGKAAFRVDTVIQDVPLNELRTRLEEAILEYHTWEEPYGHNRKPKTCLKGPKI